MRPITDGKTDGQWTTPLDDGAMEREMRALALSLEADGRGEIRRWSGRETSAPLTRVRALAEEGADLSPTLEWLMENGRVVEALREGLCRRVKGQRLPLCGERARIQLAMECLANRSAGQVSSDRLEAALLAFDEARPLSMDELWAAPSSLANALCGLYIAAARRAIEAQEERLAAAQWVENGAAIGEELARRTSAFFEYALKCLCDGDCLQGRAELARWLEERDWPQEKLIAMEHERQARDKLLLSSLLGSLRMLEKLDFTECFRRVSRTERILFEDPAGTYPRMTEESRALVRRRVAKAAEAFSMGEEAVARLVLRSAREGRDMRREVCWWLYTDRGGEALAEAAGRRVKLPPLVPDPRGRRLLVGALGGALTLFLAAGLALGWGAATLALPVLWGTASALTHGVVTRRVPPAHWLRIRPECLGEDARTLVVMPALLSDPGRARELSEQMEVLGCLERDERVGFLLLGDLPDHSQPHRPDDGDIVAAAQEGIRAANLRAGREKYFFLHRPRLLQASEGRYMGRERKRGALNALNRLLLAGKNEFCQEDTGRLKGKYDFVLTLDAGTRVLPGTILRLAGVLAHPLNRFHREEDGSPVGYGVLSPRMELPPDAAVNRFVTLYGGRGGVDTYAASASDSYQDACGQGIFGGKGIYDVKAFFGAVEGRLPDDAILSHDLVEGLLARSGLVSDMAFYDGHPRSFRAWLMRQNRWTRGDWQLLPLLLRGKLPFSALDRYKIVDNLVRSLLPVAQLLLLLWGAHTRSAARAVLGLLPFVLPLAMNPRPKKEDVVRALTRLAMLPWEAATLISAVSRALWRMAISHRGLLEWVTADDADRRGGRLAAWPGRLAAIVLLPAVFSSAPWTAPVALLAALWWTGRGLMEGLETPRSGEQVSPEDRELMLDLARRTWRFFAESVGKNGLPPDNVQIDPFRGAAKRTSPTNIGLYLASLAAARALGIISPEEETGRAEAVLNTLERLEKWNGQLYNWYHTETLEPLKPRYVSSVDSGNLAACLLLCAGALEREGAGALARRAEGLARGMDFARLLDREKKLFAIGMDVENGRLSDSRYDLLASESRILSFTAMMLGQAPTEHWARLGRAVARVGKGEALLSWSGTMFEYLMPDLLLPVWEDTLLGHSRVAVVEAQSACSMRTEEGDMPWGVSESGLYAFDRSLNYQYRAFGLPSLALRGDADGRVMAPYASALAASWAPGLVADNIRRMLEWGLADDMGLFEAADCNPARIPEGASMRVVRSHMAHHQGMILCALANALEKNALVRLFTRRPEAQALLLLLQEKPAPRVRMREREERPCAQTRPRPASSVLRTAKFHQPLPDVHLMNGGGTLAALAADGSGFVRRGDLLLNRRECDPGMPPQGLFIHARDRLRGRSILLTGMEEAPGDARVRVTFGPGSALYHTQTSRLEARVRALVSPEDGALMQHVTLVNRTAEALDMELTSCFQPALAREGDYVAHPAFQNLSLSSALAGEGALCFSRRPRDPEDRYPVLIHQLAGAEGGSVSWETDLTRLTGRNRQMSQAGALAEELSGTLGDVITPCSALRVRFRLPARGERAFCFSMGFAEEGEREAFLTRHAAMDDAGRALELATTQAGELARYMGLKPSFQKTLDRGAALLLYAPGRNPIRGTPPKDFLRRRDLWAMGLSGDLPILLGFAERAEELESIRALIRGHEYYRAMGVECDLVLVNDEKSDYHRPVRDALAGLVAGSHLSGRTGVPGGAHLLEGGELTEGQRTLLRMAAGVVVESGESLEARVDVLLAEPPMARWHGKPMEDVVRERPEGLLADNGWGGFSPEGGYVIYRTPTPAPWCNMLVNRTLGALVSERGGGFIWCKNSRNGRLTPFDNDPIREGWGDLVILKGPRGQVFAPALRSGRITHRMGESVFEGEEGGVSWRLEQFVDAQMPVKCQRLRLEGDVRGDWRAEVDTDFVLGVTRADRRFTVTGEQDGIWWARGDMNETAFACFVENSGGAENGRLAAPLSPLPDGGWEAELLVGAAESMEEILALLARWKELGGGDKRRRETLAFWRDRLDAVRLHTPDPLVNLLVSDYLPYQALCARVWGRAGLYQPGGAYGFRDQLQDMLCLLPTDPAMVRAHLLLCAAHQFESGDVMHWWHPERTGVRTHIRDDMLFLPYVTAQYVEETGDWTVLGERVAYLKDVDIPGDREDWYGEAELSDQADTLHDHCLRAIERAFETGEHGLVLMGAGDWNDGMNRVGRRGRGESVWLSEFMVVVLEEYAPLCGEEKKEEYLRRARTLREALEKNAWDGKWYRRAYDDEGRALGSEGTRGGCRIDALTQSWAVMAGLNEERARQAMEEADRRLTDREGGVIRLLTPPFEGQQAGYIGGYPPGVRENGGQYTHAACWVAMAWARLGDAQRAWDAWRMLLPSAHSDTEEKAARYRVEPYVMAADVYGEAPHTGRGGWTWYTGAAGWMVRVAYVELMGFERRGEWANMKALLPREWDEAALSLRVGSAKYTFIASRGCEAPTLDGMPLEGENVRLVDDGKSHTAVFPPRRGTEPK